MIRVFDAEANGLLNTVTKVWCISFRRLDGELDAAFGPDEMEEACEYMARCETLIGHNVIGYDFPLFKKLLGFEYKGRVIDTLILSRMFNPKRTLPPNAKNRRAGPHGLYAWGVRVGVDKPEIDDWEVYTPAIFHRNKEDTRINVAVYHELVKEGKTLGGSWKSAVPMTMTLFHYLQKQEDYGWRVDREWMDICIARLENRIKRIDRSVAPYLPLVVEVGESKKDGVVNYVRKPFLKSGAHAQIVIDYFGEDSDMVTGQFSRVSFRPVDLNSNAEVKDFLLEDGWEPLEWNTNDEGVRTSPKLSQDDPFEGVNGAVGRLIAKRVQARHRMSTIAGLIRLIRPDGTISGAVANLTDTARATHRNIVNIPKVGSYFGAEMRKIFSTREGMVLVGTDSDSCQLRMLGARIKNHDYIKAITTGDKSKGTDLHSMTRKIGELESRDNAKNVIYCLLFGGGDTKLGKTAKKPGQGAELRQKLYRGFDGLGEHMEDLKAEWKATAKRRHNAKFNRMEYYNGFITGLDGRPIRVPYEHQLLVYELQSDEAIMMSAAYIKANLECEKRGWVYGEDYGFVAWYHDEFTIECKPELADEVGKISAEAIAWAGRHFDILCPHIGEPAVGRNWKEIH